MSKPLNLEQLQSHCITQLAPILGGVRKAHDGQVPNELLNNHYLLGYIWGMVSVSMNRAHLENEGERGHTMIEVTATLLQQNAQRIGSKLATLHQSNEDLDYLEGINDGTDRMAAPSEGRREEVIYRLMHRLEPYC
ncbi:hypothetical protein [Magnetococcus sp. PR-3]|uniref:hypothetical protein n=1 Tax=Magnetococcus sp. PR-3 TaxID=3120355 RepID=UPI002FCDEA30